MSKVPKKQLPFEVIRLDTFPQSAWIGKTVLHPMEQSGDGPKWNTDDYAFGAEDDEANSLVFDLGIVTEVFEHPDGLGDLRCLFLVGGGVSLHYSPDNLWVPVTCAEVQEHKTGLEIARRGSEGGWKRADTDYEIDNIYIEEGEWVWQDGKGNIRRHYGYAGGSQYKVHTFTEDGECRCAGMACDEPEWDSAELDGEDWWLLPSLRKITENLPITNDEE